MQPRVYPYNQRTPQVFDAVGNILFAATDEGIARVEIENGKINLVKEFPDTVQFVNSGCHLFVGNDGIYSVKRSEITRLQIK